MLDRSFRVIFLGPPGAGKGTISAMAAERLGIPHISTGDMFRAAVKGATPLGLEIKEILARGGLVPDALTIALVKERLAQPDTVRGFILDGFPRTVPQAEALEELGGIDAAVDFEVSDELVVFRLTGRRVCGSCGAIYHVANKPPRQEDICDRCGGRLTIRNDDRPETVHARLAAYHAETEPLKSWYGARGLLLTIDGAPDAETVYRSFTVGLEHFLAER